MLKKLVALTLVALMVINPMTAMAVSWNQVRAEVLANRNQKRTFDGETVTAILDDSGKVTIGGTGTLTDFEVSNEFSSYEFTGTITINNQVFDVFIKDNEEPDGIATPEAVAVNIESGVTIKANVVHLGAAGGHELTFNNAGIIDIDHNAELVGGDGKNYSGTMHIDANSGGNVIMTNNGSINVENEFGNWAENNGSIEINNNKDIVAERIWANAAQDSSVTVKNSTNGEISFDEGVVDDGDMNSGSVLIMTDANGKVEMTNDGKISGEARMDLTGTGTGKLVNNGTVAGMGAGVWGETSATLINSNSGTVNGNIEFYVSGAATADVNNSGTAESMYATVGQDASATVTNDGTINYKLAGEAFGDSELNVVSNGTVGDGEQNYDEEGNAIAPDGIWVGTYGDSTGSAVNNGTINGELGVGARDEASVAATNNGTAETGWVDSYDNGNVTMDIGGISGQTTMAGDNVVTMIITAPSSDVTDVETIAALIEKSVSRTEDSTVVIGDIYTKTDDGELIARYSVAADGTVVLEEVLMEQGGDGDDPRFWTKERIRHDMEEKRKAAAIGGVYGSPYWLKQLYLGYMSLNLRLFSGDEQLLFKENISWVPGANVAGEKILTLNVKLEDTANLAMRLDGAVIDKLEQADIVTINIVDGAGNLFMEYKVEDLKGAREMYGLTAKEYIVVGSADADVMKIAEDGTISPIEGETEAEPVEEVAEEAKAETEAEAAEETPAA